MNSLSPLAWIGIGFILISIVGFYLWLFSLLRSGGKDQRPSEWSRMTRTLRNPFEKQNKQMDELAKRVKDLKNNPK